MRRPISPLCAFVAALLMAGCDETPVGIAVDLIEVELVTLDGEKERLMASPQRARIINFWATWCAPCREEMPDLQQLSEQLDPAVFEVVGVTVDRDLNLVREFMLKNKVRFRQLSDASMQLATDAKVNAFPETFLVSADGKVLRRLVGIQPWADDAFIDQFIAPIKEEDKQQ